MKIVMAGGTGFIGSHLCRLLGNEGHSLIVLSRHPEKKSFLSNNRIHLVRWNGQENGPWAESCKDADVVINLSGAPIADKRWTPARKRELTDSRVQTTQALLTSVAKWPIRPKTFISASGVGFYGDRGSEKLNETSPAGKGFLADLCLKWEAAAQQGEELGMRVLSVRFGMVLGRNGGALPRMTMPFKFFLGGPILPGTQFVSWIHVTDLSRLILWLINNQSTSGPVNGVAPDPVTMREFCQSLGEAMHRPSVMPVPKFALRIGLGELASMLTTGQRVYPQKALNGGFAFSYPTLPDALQDLLSPSHP